MATVVGIDVRTTKSVTRVGRALLAGGAREGAVIRVGHAEGDLTVTYENPA